MVAMMQSIVLLLVGFVLLIKGADFFVEGSSSVARALRIPSMIVGLTIVAMGTSLPELAVSVTASVAGNNALAVSNVIGSNLFNLMLVCGACALFAPLIVQKDTLKKEIPVSVLCAVLLFVLGISGMEIGRTDGVILLLLFIGFLVWMVRSALKAHAASAEAEDPSGEYKIYPAWKCALYIVGGAYLIGKQYEAEKLNHGGDQKSNLKKSTGQNGQSIDKRWTRRRIADENGVNDSFVKRAEQFSKGVDAAEKAVPGTRQKVLTGEVKPTAAEIASVARAPPEERPALVAEICKPKDQKKAAMTRTTPPPAAKPLSDSSTSEEESTDEELVHTPAPQEQTFPQRVNEPLKIDRQQILEIANSRYVPKRLADGTAMLCEVSGAANSMMRRWESVFREYPDILSDAENRASVGRTIQKLRDYLNNLEDKMEELL